LDTTEKRILQSAKEIFHKKGLQGARMQEIADAAGINKAMLHYYYRSKDKLFEAVFNEASSQFFPKVFELLNTERPLFEKIEHFVENYIEMLIRNPFMPVFILTEISQNPENFAKVFDEHKLKLPEMLIKQLGEAMQRGEIIPMDPRHLILNMLGMCVFPFAARIPVTKILKLSDKEYMDLMEERKKIIPQFIINAIKTR
jgi:AcrR family transcriptional regulator